MKNKNLLVIVILLALLASTVSMANQIIVLDGEKTMAIETAVERNNEIIELEEQLATVEFKNKQLTKSVNIKNREIKELRNAERNYQALEWQVENFEYLLSELLNKIDSGLEVEGH